mgnify:CR=1 FL=1
MTGLIPAQVEFFSSEQLVEFVPLVDAPAIPTLSVRIFPSSSRVRMLNELLSGHRGT